MCIWKKQQKKNHKEAEENKGRFKVARLIAQLHATILFFFFKKGHNTNQWIAVFSDGNAISPCSYHNIFLICKGEIYRKIENFKRSNYVIVLKMQSMKKTVSSQD